MIRCKNMRTNEPGKAKTRDGSKKINVAAIEAAIWWIEEQNGDRYTFAGTVIYKNEVAIGGATVSAQWAAIKYNAFNDTTDNIFGVNGTDRRRIEASTVYEWGIEAPTAVPGLTNGQAKGLTGTYNVRYTYLRKVGSLVVSESNPSPTAVNHVELIDQSLAVDIAASSDPQVTHARLYRTLDNGLIYYRDQDVPIGGYTHGVSHEWEGAGVYIAGNSFKFTIEDTEHGTENTYTWEVNPDSDIDDGSGYDEGTNWWNESDPLYQEYLAALRDIGGLGGGK
jgi:hypothetical protein